MKNSVLLNVCWLWLASPLLAAPAASAQTPIEVKEMNTQGVLRLRYESMAKLAIERNLTLKSAGFDVDFTQAEYKLSVAQGNPNLTVTSLYEHKDATVVAGLLPETRFIPLAEEQHIKALDLYLGAQNSMLNRAMLFVPVYSGGRLQSQMHARAALAEAARVGLRKTRQKLAYQAKLQYLDALLARENVEVARQNLRQAESIAHDASSRFKSGVANQYDVLQAEVTVSNSQDALFKTQGSLKVASDELAALLNEPLSSELQLNDELTTPRLVGLEQIPGPEPEHLAFIALTQRPELEELRARLLANHELTGVAEAGLWPQLNLNLDYELLGAPAELRGGMTIISTLLIPFFDGGLSRAQAEEVEILRAQLTTEELKATQKIVLETIQASLDVREADSRLQLASSLESQAEETRRIATRRFRVGAGSSLDLANAQTISANAGFSLAQARQRQIAARAALNFALGEDAQ